MSSPFFTWDEEKSRENQHKHGISFDEAMTVFTDENARLIHDPDHSDDEERFILLGFSSKARLIVVIHTYRKRQTEIRIISARKANKRECDQYGSFL